MCAENLHFLSLNLSSAVKVYKVASIQISAWVSDHVAHKHDPNKIAKGFILFI